MVVPVAAGAALEIEFEVRRFTRRDRQRGDRFVRQQRTSEICVQDRAGQVEHCSQRGARRRCQVGRDPVQQDACMTPARVRPAARSARAEARTCLMASVTPARPYCWISGSASRVRSRRSTEGTEASGDSRATTRF